MGDPTRRLRSKLLVFPFVALAMFAMVFGVWNALDNAHALAIVGKPTKANGMVRGLATFRPEGTYPVPPCIASYKRGKSTNHTHFSGDNRVRFDDGAEYVLPETQKIEFFQNDGPERAAGKALSTATRSYLSRIKPDVKEFQSVACLTPNEKVWVEACVYDGALVGCADRADPVLLTVGGADARTSYVMSHAHGSIALALLGFGVLLLVVTAPYRHGRRVVRDLARRHGVTGAETFAIVLFAIGALGSFISLATWSTQYGPWFLCAFVALLAILTLSTTIGRLRILGAARRALIATETTQLNSEQGLDRELAVHVAEDAPPIEGFRGGDRHAIVRFRIVESYAEKQGSKTVVATRDVLEGVYPKLVPIVDASGRGMLALDHCTIDVPDQKEALWVGRPTSPSWFSETFELEPSPTHRGYVAFWGAVQPGDPLLIHGGVERVRPATVGAAENPGYRAPDEIPLVRGQEHAPAIAYVGTEATLTRGIATERVALIILVLLSGGATAAAAIAFASVLHT
jgi:hypothetical protein